MLSIRLHVLKTKDLGPSPAEALAVSAAALCVLRTLMVTLWAANNIMIRRIHVLIIYNIMHWHVSFFDRFYARKLFTIDYNIYSEYYNVDLVFN